LIWYYGNPFYFDKVLQNKRAWLGGVSSSTSVQVINKKSNNSRTIVRINGLDHQLLIYSYVAANLTRIVNIEEKIKLFKKQP
jgi:hypothetical protein